MSKKLFMRNAELLLIDVTPWFFQKFPAKCDSWFFSCWGRALRELWPSNGPKTPKMGPGASVGCCVRSNCHC